MATIDQLRATLGEGLVIPACPLALNANRKLDERRQRGLLRYYLAAGAGGLAVGVHTTQFAIRDPRVGLFRPVLQLAIAELQAESFPLPLGGEGQGEGAVRGAGTRKLGIAGICGETKQAISEAQLIRELGFDAGLLSLGALQNATEEQLLAHCQTISKIVPLIGFYLQPAAGGRILEYVFWRRFAEIENVVAIKIAPFNRYQTLDVVRAVAESGREEIALYTGNDDNIVMDLLTPFRFQVGGNFVERRIVGGLLGHWAVWTHKAVQLHRECRRLAESGKAILPEMLQRSVEVTDANAAIFDAANAYAGCIPGIHEILRRQGLLEGAWCIDPSEVLSSGQREEIERVYRAYPDLNDDEFVSRNRDQWLR